MGTCGDDCAGDAILVRNRVVFFFFTDELRVVNEELRCWLLCFTVFLEIKFLLDGLMLDKLRFFLDSNDLALFSPVLIVVLDRFIFSESFWFPSISYVLAVLNDPTLSVFSENRDTISSLSISSGMRR